MTREQGFGLKIQPLWNPLGQTYAHLLIYYKGKNK